jgi:hypothetical protein
MATFSNDINAFSFGVSYRTVQNRFDNQQLSNCSGCKSKIQQIYDWSYLQPWIV